MPSRRMPPYDSTNLLLVSKYGLLFDIDTDQIPRGQGVLVAKDQSIVLYA